jgi:hypothetical protein
MSRSLLRAVAVGAVALFGSLLVAQSAKADIQNFSDVGGHITGVRVSHGPTTLGITAYDAQMTLGTYYHFFVDTDSANPGPEYKAEIFPNSDGILLKRVGNFASRGIITRCRGLRGVADVFGDDYAKVIIPRSCIGGPSRVRVSVVGYYDENNDDRIDVVDWAPGEERFYPWVNR